jgi:hypothetical protein
MTMSAQAKTPEMTANLAAVWEDTGSVIKSRGIATMAALEVVGTVSAMRDALAAAGHRVKSPATYGYVVGAARMVSLAGFALNTSKVPGEIWQTLAGLVESRGSKPAMSAATEAVKNVLDTVTSAERLDMIVGAVAALPVRASKGQRAARPEGNDTSADDAADAGPALIAPADVKDADRASDAARQSLAHALSLLSGGATVTDAIRDLLADLSAIATVGVEVDELIPA